MKSVPEKFREWLPYLAGILAAGGLLLMYLATSRTIVVIADGEEILVRTHARTVASVLRAAGFGAQEVDRAFPDLSSRVGKDGVIEVRLAHKVKIDVDGHGQEILTSERIAANILASMDLSLLPGDQLWADGIPLSDPGKALDRTPTTICLRRARTITLQADGQERILRSAAATLGEALEEAGIELHEADILDPHPNTPLDGLSGAELIRSRPILIFVDGNPIVARVVAQTVGEALLKAGVALVGLDTSLPMPAEALPEDGQIRVIRVREEVSIEQIPLPFETVYEASSELELDSQAVLDSGSYGVLARRIRVRYENDEEISRTAEGEWVAREPVARKIGYGTKIVVRALDTPDGPIEYWRALKMYATSYSPSRSGTSPDAPWYGKTACGKTLVKGLVAIDNRYIPFYTKMYVPGYGFAEACDVGGGVVGRWIDLGYEDHNYRSWHHWVTVYFLTPVSPATSITWVFP